MPWKARLESADATDLQALFDELLPEALKLMTDVFGNYVVQKLLEHGTEHHGRVPRPETLNPP